MAHDLDWFVFVSNALFSTKRAVSEVSVCRDAGMRFGCMSNSLMYLTVTLNIPTRYMISTQLEEL